MLLIVLSTCVLIYRCLYVVCMCALLHVTEHTFVWDGVHGVLTLHLQTAMSHLAGGLPAGNASCQRAVLLWEPGNILAAVRQGAAPMRFLVFASANCQCLTDAD